METVLVKLSGELLSEKNSATMTSVVAQLKTLSSTHKLGIVIGGGNFFRGAQHGVAQNITRNTADSIGMLATVMNALMLHDLCKKAGIATTVLSSVSMPQICNAINPETLADSHTSNKIIIFAGGTGCPYFSTDTNAVVRALQINATQLWKGTKVDGVYDTDPQKGNANLLPTLSYKQAIDQQLGVMDTTALTLAQQNGILTRVFNIFADTALLNAANDTTIGSTIT